METIQHCRFLESLLNNCIERYPILLPELHPNADINRSSVLNQPHHTEHIEKKQEHKKTQEDVSPSSTRKNKKSSKTSTTSDTTGILRQPTLYDVLEKAGAITSEQIPSEDSSGLSTKGRSCESSEKVKCDSETVIIDMSAFSKSLETQRSKFRPLLVQCYSILVLSENEASCCSNAAAKLPLYLYLLRDLHIKLEYFNPGKHLWGKCLSSSAGFTRMTLDEFLSRIEPHFPSLKRHLDSAVCLLKQGGETCEENWKNESISAGNPDIPNLILSNYTASNSVFKELLNLPGDQTEKPALLHLLEAFQPERIPDSFYAGIQPNFSPGTAEYLYFGA